MNGWILELTVLKLAVSFSMIVVGIGMMIQIPILKSIITTYAALCCIKILKTDLS